MFEYMNKRTHDPEERYLKAVKLFSSEYFNTPENLMDDLLPLLQIMTHLLKK